MFLPLFFQLVLGYAPAKAGLMMAPMTAGVVVSSFVGGRLVSMTGKYKIFPVAGLAAASLAFLAVMASAALQAPIGVIETSLIVLGLGFGLVMPNLMVAIQNAVQVRDLGAATAGSAFFRSLGGAFGVALSGAIMTAGLGGQHAGSGLRMHLGQRIQEIAAFPPEQRIAVIGLYRNAITRTFLLGAVITALAFLLVLFLPEHPLRSGRAPGAAPGPAME